MTDSRSPVPAPRSPINVLIVDDSASVRMHLRNILESDPDIRIIGAVGDGEEAVRFVENRKPDVITMDIDMPKMNGLEAIRRIMETHPLPIIVVSATFDKNDVERTFIAMDAGAIAVSNKPLGEGHRDSERAARDLVQTVKAMSEVKMVKRWSRARISGMTHIIEPEEPLVQASGKVKLVVIGASTGGPPVIKTILSGLTNGLHVPLLVVQHIAKGFLEGMVEWLNHTTGLPVHIAMHKERLMPGHVYFAPDDYHMGVNNAGRIELSKALPENALRPSVSYLFRSTINAFDGDSVGVLLTGMGKDGAEELRHMKEKGATTIAQDEESSVVFGMPGEAVRLGAATHILPPEKIAAVIRSLTKES